MARRPEGRVRTGSSISLTVHAAAPAAVSVPEWSSMPKKGEPTCTTDQQFGKEIMEGDSARVLEELSMAEPYLYPCSGSWRISIIKSRKKRRFFPGHP